MVLFNLFRFAGRKGVLPDQDRHPGQHRVQTKLRSDPALYAALDSIVAREASAGKMAHAVTSGSHALLWLVRSLMFVHNFLRKLIESLGSVERCLVAAYGDTLSKHHGLVVRSVFSVS
jgi:hypothetical protein